MLPLAAAAAADIIFMSSRLSPEIANWLKRLRVTDCWEVYSLATVTATALNIRVPE
jgi:hypothetical protein